ncbi:MULTISPECIES: hypothetical protein [Streptomyces]|uniref:Uncharacterized protein n=1 Tax=Streptomyces doudnae TaxID=3075536 RepID=A0ABD5EZB9_9ACTN|nr:MULTISPECIES: hypothetical protein [unclassified Streptomyces]MDT0439714.1 hypothetical protein [Streptomyces sp. DSM 41981]MYQ69348.1 hypothetical protein [Streptomyces sp. SID4950]SCE53028.1 hypothetical protein GA0115242_147626 [Streptomyces sp. SolWspMP-5a-2]
MTDFHAEAIKVYETTRSSDTRGIISALLHLAETMAPAVPSSPGGGTSLSWQGPALAYVQGNRHQKMSVDHLAKWLTQQGFDVDKDAVSRGMWELHGAGRVGVHTGGDQPVFSAVPERR